MSDAEFYEGLEKLSEMLLKNAKHCYGLDFAVINDIGIEIARRKEMNKNMENRYSEMLQEFQHKVNQLKQDLSRCRNIANECIITLEENGIEHDVSEEDRDWILPF